MNYPKLRADNGNIYSIEQASASGKWCIVCEDLSATWKSDAVDSVFNRLDYFASAIKAYKYMKENLNTIELI